MTRIILSLTFFLLLACNKDEQIYLQKVVSAKSPEQYLIEKHGLELNAEFNAEVLFFFPGNCGSCSITTQNFLSGLDSNFINMIAIVVGGNEVPEFLTKRDLPVLEDNSTDIYNYGFPGPFDCIHVYRNGKLVFKENLVEENFERIMQNVQN